MEIKIFLLGRIWTVLMMSELEKRTLIIKYLYARFMIIKLIVKLVKNYNVVNIE